jgi:hypothetical protein|tara:strand:- start:154 stop:360 length:207 start_codon:yes stop_codon:yes gene_type:complete
MEKRKEPFALFIPLDKVVYKKLPYRVLSVHTYCLCCDRFLDETSYLIVATTGGVFHRVTGSDLTFLEE